MRICSVLITSHHCPQPLFKGKAPRAAEQPEVKDILRAFSLGCRGSALPGEAQGFAP